ncbi:MAG: P22 phage major capsid protein family protein [Pseudomonadota bacterium]
MPQLTGTDNRLLTNDEIAREALRLLKNNLAVLRRVHRGYERSFNGNGQKIGSTISMKLPYRVKTANGRVAVRQPMVDQNTNLTIDQQKHVMLNFNQIDKTLSINQFAERYLRSAMVSLAHAVDRDILEVIQAAGFYSSGTPGTALSTDAMNDARAYMTKVGVPMDNMQSAFLDPLDCAAINKEIKLLDNAAMIDDAIKGTYKGNLSSFETFETAQMPVHAVGAHGGTPLIQGANQSGASLTTDGWSSSTQVLNQGDIFTIAGVYEVNPQTYESTGRLQRFTATANVTSNGGGVATIPISPEINDGTNTTLDGQGSNVSLTAYQNVTAEPADNAAITVIGTAQTQYREALLFHRDAIAVAVVDIELPESAVVASRATDEDTGLSLLLTAEWDGTNFEQSYRVDVLYGRKAIYPELIHRIPTGTNA